MIWSSACKADIRRQVPLADLTWFGLGGPARWMVSPESVEELADVVASATEEQVPYKVLGRGANVLVRDEGFDGLVIRLDRPAFCETCFDEDRVNVGAGVDLMRLSLAASRRGLAGLEPTAGIPATVGGAVRMNAGGRLGEFGDVVESVCIVEPDGRIRDVFRDELEFGYRRSAVGSRIVVSAVLKLRPEDPREVSERVRAVWREKKASQPLAAQSAGCVFKNPEGGAAGALIDRAKLKGVRRGGACVSARHANFIEVDEGARSADVLALIDHVRGEVARIHGVELELEIDVW